MNESYFVSSASQPDQPQRRNAEDKGAELQRIPGGFVGKDVSIQAMVANSQVQQRHHQKRRQPRQPSPEKGVVQFWRRAAAHLPYIA